MLDVPKLSTTRKVNSSEPLKFSFGEKLKVPSELMATLPLIGAPPGASENVRVSPVSTSLAVSVPEIVVSSSPDADNASATGASLVPVTVTVTVSTSVPALLAVAELVNATPTTSAVRMISPLPPPAVAVTELEIFEFSLIASNKPWRTSAKVD